MKKILTLALVASALAGAVQAQTWNKLSSGSKQNVRAATINSATTLADMPVVDSTAGLVVTISGTYVGTADLQRRLANGTVLTSETVNVYTTPTTVSITGPLYFEGIRISPTIPLTNTSTTHVIGVFSKQ
jgi:hypothetical protein